MGGEVDAERITPERVLYRSDIRLSALVEIGTAEKVSEALVRSQTVERWVQLHPFEKYGPVGIGFLQPDHRWILIS